MLLGLHLSPTSALAWVVVLVAAFVQSLTGFGFALVSVPILVMLWEPKAIVPTSLILGGVLNLIALHGNGRKNSCGVNWSLLMGGLAGVPLGAFLLRVLDPLALRLVVGLTGALFGTAMLLGRTWHFQRPRVISVAIGVVSGALNSSTSMGGGAVALFLANQETDKDGFRRNLLFYILLVNIVALIALIPAGLLTYPVLWLSLRLMPAMLFGFALGNWLFPRLRTALFNRVVVGVVIATSVAGALVALAGYLQAVSVP